MKKLKEKKVVIKYPGSGWDKRLILKTFKLPNGVNETFFVDNDNHSVQIFPITKEGNVVTVIQFRPGSEKDEIELPGGGITKGEKDHSKSAARELREETGHEGDLEYLGSSHYSPYSNGVRHMYLAKDCVKVARSLDLDPNEFLKVKIVPLEEFRDMMKTGKVRGTDLAYMALDFLKML